MKIIISPAKRMKADADVMPARTGPMFPEKTRVLAKYLRGLSLQELRELLRCSEAIAVENYRRYQAMENPQPRTPAIFAYQGIQYQYMGQNAFTDAEYLYLQNHLCILSGFYGLLRPFDGILPYRLEMQAKLKTDFCENLYQFWGDSLGQALSRDNRLVLDLASQEYSLAARQGLSPEVRRISFRFGTVQDGKLRETGTQVKMARGAMVRYLAESRITEVSEVRNFSELGYRFSPERSDNSLLVFTRDGNFL